jgi:DNA-binding MarR family transcriptional regulator
VAGVGSTAWLSLDEQRAWRAHLQAVRRVMDALEGQLQRDAGLSHADYEILVRLSEAPGRQLRMSVLAEALSFSRSRTSHAVDRLERAGWVRREAIAGDGRGMVALLTEAGSDKLVDAAPGHVRAVREHLVDRLSLEQVAQLEAISTAVCRPPSG